MGIRTPTSLDTTPLTAPVDRTLLRAYRATLPAPLRRATTTLLTPGVILCIAGVVLAGMWTWLLLDDRATPPTGMELLLLLPGFLVPVAGIVLIVFAFARRNGAKQFRLSRFAAANDFSYQPAAEVVFSWPGMIFGQGSERITFDLVRTGDGGPVIGNHTFTTGGGRNRQRHRWGFAAVQLGTMLPHIVLDARGNNSLLGASNLPVAFEREQRLDLEGDFARYFALYCPRGYEADAHYLFTPDIMARFIDHAAELDVEIVDDHLLLYSRKDLATVDPEVWEWLFATIDALTAKIDQWQRWRDDRLGRTQIEAGNHGIPQIMRPPVGVARQGRRLTQKFPWFWVVLGVLGLIWTCVSIIGDIVSWLTG